MKPEVKFRMTLQRRVILEELKKLTGHPTADQIHAVVRRRLPRISLGTVYRNLQFLTDSGTIRKLEIGGGGQGRFEPNLHEHYHVRCVGCGRVDDFPAVPAVKIDKNLKQFNGYQIIGYRLVFLGLCSSCKNKGRVQKKSRTD